MATRVVGEVTGQPQHRSIDGGVAAARVSAACPGTSTIPNLAELSAYLPNVVRRVVDVGQSLRPPQDIRELRRAVRTSDLQTVIVADMDGTLTPPGSDISEEMVESLIRVIEADVEFVILTSSGIQRVKSQVLERLCSRADTRVLRNIHVFAAQGGQGYRFSKDGKDLEQMFLVSLADDNVLGPEGVRRLKTIIFEAAKHYALPTDEESIIVDHTSQLTLMVLGRGASQADKEVYDKSGGKARRAQIADYLNRCFAGANLHVFARPAGQTSINIAPSWINKAFGIEKIVEILNIAPSQIIYIGDEFRPGGVDASVVGRVLAAVNVGPTLAPSASSKDTIVMSRSLGTKGTREVLTMVLAARPAAKNRTSSEPLRIAA